MSLDITEGSMSVPSGKPQTDAAQERSQVLVLLLAWFLGFTRFHMCLYIVCVYINRHTRKSIYIYVHTCMYVCVYIYTYTYTRMHMHSHMYMHTSTCNLETKQNLDSLCLEKSPQWVAQACPLRRQGLCRIGEVTNGFGVWDPPPCSAEAKFTTKQTAEDDSAIIYKGKKEPTQTLIHSCPRGGGPEFFLWSGGEELVGPVGSPHTRPWSGCHLGHLEYKYMWPEGAKALCPLLFSSHCSLPWGLGVTCSACGLSHRVSVSLGDGSDGNGLPRRPRLHGRAAEGVRQSQGEDTGDGEEAELRPQAGGCGEEPRILREVGDPERRDHQRHSQGWLRSWASRHIHHRPGRM